MKASLLAPLPAAAAPTGNAGGGSLDISLDGPWEFRLDQEKAWRVVQVPHTWQVEPAHAEYTGAAWYRRQITVPAGWKGHAVRAEFEAVFHTAEVRLNGRPVASHTGKGYTAFTADLTAGLEFGAVNTLEVRADNSFSDTMLPRGNSYDWTMDGGIYRPVRLRVTPPLYVDVVHVDALPSADYRTAQVNMRVELAGVGDPVDVACELLEESTGRIIGPVADKGGPGLLRLPVILLDAPKLWHFDHPHLYRAVVTAGGHRVETTFGVRRFEIRGTSFHLNGEKVRLHGVERMAGSHPAYGMAEPAHWIEHDNADMKELNCVFTRVHWMQDRRLLDWCDRHGMVIQLEVPTWGPNTFRGMGAEPSPEIMRNALEQLREMIRRDYNHPCILTWGLCNEVNGQGAAQKMFVRKMKEEARRLDPHRPLTYASHSLFTNPGNDISGEMDFVSWNEYYGSWQKGGPEDLRRNLKEVIAAFPGKPIVMSEYGYCACTADRPEADDKRTDVLRAHNAVFREFPEIAGLIFFCYNDYRTHMGDKGLGVMKQRVHGVVDVYGARKPSYDLLRRESSPVESVRASGEQVSVRAKASIPAYTMRGYSLKWTVYGLGDIPLEEGHAALPDLAPGAEARVQMAIREKDRRKVKLDVMRPTGFSAWTEWI